MVFLDRNKYIIYEAMDILLTFFNGLHNIYRKASGYNEGVDNMCAEHGDNGYDENEYNCLINKLENAYKVYRLSEVFLNDVIDDYGKQKIARLRLEFARHELQTLIEEAREKGIKWQNNDIVRKYFYRD